MIRRKPMIRGYLGALALAAIGVASGGIVLRATQVIADTMMPDAAESPSLVTESNSAASAEINADSADAAEAPIDPRVRVLEMHKQAEVKLREVQDMQAIFIKRERIRGRLGDAQEITMKIRHEPFSVYLRVMAPNKVAGREALYVDGQNDGKLWAHGTGIQKWIGTVSLEPTSPMVMRETLFPITDAGPLRLVKRLLKGAEGDLTQETLKVEIKPGFVVDDRPVTRIELHYPQKVAGANYRLLRAFYDDAWKFPVRNELYDWPTKEGEEPVLLGEYTYTQLELNVGLTDDDFDVENEEYEF